MKIARPTIERDIAFFYIGIACFFLVIVGRLFYLQIYANNEFFTRAQKNYTRTLSIKPQRGNILDCHGNLLATNRPFFTLFWQGTGNRSLSQDQLNTLEILQEITEQNLSDQETITTIKYAERTNKKVALINDITLDQLSKIMEKFPYCNNIAIENQLRRFYPYNFLASHILGYIGSISFEQTGKMGLERLFEDVLKGHEGQLLKIINSVGSNLYQEETQHALSGQDIQTTLDLSLQKIAEDCFDQDLVGALIVLDPNTGALKTLISRPSFDPNFFLNPVTSQEWIALQEKQPFLNRAFNAAYPPASLFKLVTLSAALELGIIHENAMADCHGHILFCGRPYRCNKRLYGHGKLSIIEWIAKSCNIPFYEIGRKISINTLADYAHKFGLGQKTNIIFNEKEGLVPTSEWKLRTKGERWWPGETLSATIGQSYFLATPIQIARMIASIFTGSLITPRILENEPITRQPLGMRPKTIKILKQSLKSVVTQGTGIRVNKISDIKIYAKTGTAQISSLEKRLEDEQFLEHAWFVGHFRYKKTEPLVLVILVEKAGSSKVATSIAKQFLLAYRSHKQETENQNL